MHTKPYGSIQRQRRGKYITILPPLAGGRERNVVQQWERNRHRRRISAPGHSFLLCWDWERSFCCWDWGCWPWRCICRVAVQARTVNHHPRRRQTDIDVPTIPVDLVGIPGGKFTMGRNDGSDWEKGEHEVEVKSFRMDKTEVTNEAYYEFIAKTGYERIPENWVNGKPKAGFEKHPVQYVSFDDAVAFAKWRSERDGQKYRLPTEQEWEYAARNGGKNNLYPWGDTFEPRCGHRSAEQPAERGRNAKLSNQWGVQDMIGNVFEWTSSEISVHPGQPEPEATKALTEPYYMVRGGAALSAGSGQNKITSTSRYPTPASQRSVELGFRLVRE